jgi:hypothetical protein
MAWFRNHYVCIVCDGHWIAERSAALEDDCPFCRAYGVTPYKSDDRTVIVEPDGDVFVVLSSPDTAAQDPDYRPLGRFASRDKAKAFLAAR